VDRLDERDLVDVLGDVRKQLAHPRARLSVLLEGELGRGDREARLPRGHGRQPLAADDGGRQVLVEHLLHLRLVVVEVHLRRAAVHEQVDEVLRLRGEVRRELLRESVAREQRSERGGPDAGGRHPEEPAPRDVLDRDVHRIGHRLISC
jgi:hypothetical protein